MLQNEWDTRFAVQMLVGTMPLTFLLQPDFGWESRPALQFWSGI
jgi:hypothetical protein